MLFGCCSLIIWVKNIKRASVFSSDSRANTNSARLPLEQINPRINWKFKLRCFFFILRPWQQGSNIFVYQTETEQNIHTDCHCTFSLKSDCSVSASVSICRFLVSAAKRPNFPFSPRNDWWQRHRAMLCWSPSSSSHHNICKSEAGEFWISLLFSLLQPFLFSSLSLMTHSIHSLYCPLPLLVFLVFFFFLPLPLP